MSNREKRMPGLWNSPVGARDIAAGTRLSEPCWDTEGELLAWVEGRSDRGVIVLQEPGGSLRDLTPPDMSVRAFVGYGGGDFTLHAGIAYFVAQADQRIYRQDTRGGRPRAITPGFGAATTPRVSPDGRWLAYVHTYEDADAIVIVDTEGKRWPTRIAEGRDFYMQPTWHPSGEALAWVEWDHPRMPWDGTELRLAGLEFPDGTLPRVASSEVIAGGTDIAILQPEFGHDGRSLYYVSDSGGWGRVRRHNLDSGEVTLYETEGDAGAPAWNHAVRRFAVLPSGDVAAVLNVRGFDRLALLGEGSVEDASGRHASYYTLSHPVASADGSKLAAVGAGPLPPRVVVIDLSEPLWRAPAVVRRSDTEHVSPGSLSRPEAVSWTSFDGEQAHGLYFPPTSEHFEASGPPPLVISVHGGPTSQVVAGWNPTAQFFATRGYAVLLPNYRGSTGYGRDYMLKLRHSWGIYDVRDSRSGAEALAREGKADLSRVVIMGGSAGGYTVLQSFVEEPGFYKAGICMFGVANMFTLASDTHKFEARYLDSMLGPLPEAAALYRERSPIFHADRIVDPIAVFQGDIDRVVPREQSDSIVASLRARGITHEYHVYEGEGHGWRKSETIDHFWKTVERFLREHVLFA
jgi:dipeptidyl aminopeptidase/acylaminoacyl peptidase